MNFVFQFRLHCKNMILEMTQSHHDDQNKNRLNYFDFFQRLVELQNKTNYY